MWLHGPGMLRRAYHRCVHDDIWPALPFQAWRDTYATLHMWTQIVGKVRMALAPRMNHWWHVPLYVTSRGPRRRRSRTSAAPSR